MIIGFADEIMGLYFAENLIKTKINLDTDEFLEMLPTKLKTAIRSPAVFHARASTNINIMGHGIPVRTLSSKLRMFRSPTVIKSKKFSKLMIK